MDHEAFLVELQQAESALDWLNSIVGGAATGATTGAVAGPWGALVGALAGAGLGALQQATGQGTPPPRPAPQPAPTPPAPQPSASQPPPPQQPAPSAPPARRMPSPTEVAALAPALEQLSALIAARQARPGTAAPPEALPAPAVFESVRYPAPPLEAAPVFESVPYPRPALRESVEPGHSHQAPPDAPPWAMPRLPAPLEASSGWLECEESAPPDCHWA